MPAAKFCGDFMFGCGLNVPSRLLNDVSYSADPINVDSVTPSPKITPLILVLRLGIICFILLSVRPRASPTVNSMNASTIVCDSGHSLL